MDITSLLNPSSYRGARHHSSGRRKHGELSRGHGKFASQYGSGEMGSSTQWEGDDSLSLQDAYPLKPDTLAATDDDDIHCSYEVTHVSPAVNDSRFSDNKTSFALPSPHVHKYSSPSEISSYRHTQSPSITTPTATTYSAYSTYSTCSASNYDYECDNELMASSPDRPPGSDDPSESLFIPETYESTEMSAEVTDQLSVAPAIPAAPRPTTSGEFCSYIDGCTTGSPLRKVVSHIFGRNKLCTRQIPGGVWVHYCRKHYQRARYRNPTGFALLQCDLVRKQINRLTIWGGVSDWIVKIRKREEVRLNQETAAGGTSTLTEGEEGTEEAVDEEDEDIRPINSGRRGRQRANSTNQPARASPWLRQSLGEGKTTAEVLEILARIEEEIQATQSNAFPDVEILPNVIIAEAGQGPPQQEQQQQQTIGAPATLPVRASTPRRRTTTQTIAAVSPSTGTAGGYHRSGNRSRHTRRRSDNMATDEDANMAVGAPFSSVPPTSANPNPMSTSTITLAQAMSDARRIRQDSAAVPPPAFTRGRGTSSTILPAAGVRRTRTRSHGLLSRRTWDTPYSADATRDQHDDSDHARNRTRGTTNRRSHSPIATTAYERNGPFVEDDYDEEEEEEQQERKPYALILGSRRLQAPSGTRHPGYPGYHRTDRRRQFEQRERDFVTRTPSPDHWHTAAANSGPPFDSRAAEEFHHFCLMRAAEEDQAARDDIARRQTQRHIDRLPSPQRGWSHEGRERRERRGY